MRIEMLTEIKGTPRSSFGHAILDGELYIVGGHPGFFHEYGIDNFSSEVHAYNFSKNTWRDCSSFPRPTEGLRVVAHNGNLYAFGGFSYDNTIADDPWPARSLESVYRYIPNVDTWEMIAEMPHRRSSHICEVVGDKAYLIGGWDGTPIDIGDTKGQFVSAIDVFDFRTRKFRPSCLEFSVLRKRRAFSSAIYKGVITVVGGLGFEGYMGSDLFSDVISMEFPQNECEKNTSGHGYNQGTWSLLPQLPLPLFSPGAGVVNGELLVAGGLSSVLPPHNGISRKQILKFSDANGRWDELPVSLSEGKSFVEVQEFPHGQAGFIGGHHGYESDRLPSTKIEVLIK